MNLQNVARTPHIAGYIQVNPPAARGEAGTLELTARTHNAPDDVRLTPRRKPHPLQARLAQATLGHKLRSIPVRVLFDMPDHNLRTRYQAWSDAYEHGPGCIGNGERANRLDTVTGVWKGRACTGPALCDDVRSGRMRCAVDCRLQVQIEGQDDPMATWIAASNSENSFRSIVGSLEQLSASFHGLRHLPLELTVFEMSTRASEYEPFTCMRLRLRTGVTLEKAANLMAQPNPTLEAYGAKALAAWAAELDQEGDVSVSQSVVAPPREKAPPAGAPSVLFADAVDVARQTDALAARASSYNQGPVANPAVSPPGRVRDHS